MREKFESIDEDGSGELDEEEMRALFDSLGRPVSKRVIANIMRLSDTDGNGMFFFFLNELHHYYASFSLTYDSPKHYFIF